MKKRLAVLLTAMMMLSTSTVFLAAGSPLNKNVAVNVNDTSGAQVTTTVAAEAKNSVVEEAASLVATETTTTTVLAVVEVTLANIPQGGVDIVFDVEGVTASDAIEAIHWKNGAWEKDSLDVVAVGNGTVTVHVTELSPIAFVQSVVKAAAPAPQPSTNETTATLPPYNPNVWPWNEIIAREEAAKAAQNAATDATLPKTGAVAVLPFAAMACLAGAVVCGRKEK